MRRYTRIVCISLILMLIFCGCENIDFRTPDTNSTETISTTNAEFKNVQKEKNKRMVKQACSYVKDKLSPAFLDKDASVFITADTTGITNNSENLSIEEFITTNNLSFAIYVVTTEDFSEISPDLDNILKENSYIKGCLLYQSNISEDILNQFDEKILQTDEYTDDINILFDSPFSILEINN